LLAHSDDLVASRVVPLDVHLVGIGRREYAPLSVELIDVMTRSDDLQSRANELGHT
jgi:hypothetical protein